MIKENTNISNSKYSLSDNLFDRVTIIIENNNLLLIESSNINTKGLVNKI